MRTKIKNAATELLIKHGYRGLRFGDVAAQLGTTRANIHYHFGNKQKLVDEVLDDYVAHTLERFQRIWTDGDASFSDKIRGTAAFNRERYRRFNRDGDGVWVETGDGTRLPLADDVDAEDGRKVTYGIRPEHLDLGPNGKGLAATVGVVEPTGPEIQVFTEIAGQRVCVVFSERHSLSPGQEIELSPALDKVHLFDAESGKRL